MEQKILFHKENWYALLVAILKRKTPEQALRELKCFYSEGNATWKWNRDITEETIKSVIEIKRQNPHMSIRAIIEQENITGISVSAMSKRIIRYGKKYQIKDDRVDERAVR